MQLSPVMGRIKRNRFILDPVDNAWQMIGHHIMIVGWCKQGDDSCQQNNQEHSHHQYSIDVLDVST